MGHLEPAAMIPVEIDENAQKSILDSVAEDQTMQSNPAAELSDDGKGSETETVQALPEQNQSAANFPPANLPRPLPPLNQSMPPMHDQPRPPGVPGMPGPMP